MHITTEFVAATGLQGPRIKATIHGVKNGKKQKNAFVGFDDSLSQEARHRQAAVKLFDKLSRTLELTGRLQLVNNRTQRSGFTFNII